MSHIVEIRIIGRKPDPVKTSQELVECYVLVDRDEQWSLRQSKGINATSFIETKFEFDYILDLIPWIAEQLKGFAVSVRADGAFKDVFADLVRTGVPAELVSFSYFAENPEINYRENVVIPQSDTPRKSLAEAEVEAAAVMLRAYDIVNAARSALEIA